MARSRANRKGNALVEVQTGSTDRIKAPERGVERQAGQQWPADQVERRAIATLVPYARNARLHTPEQVGQVATSIRTWGWTMPILVDEVGGIIAGHCRVLAAESLGIAEVPVMVARGWSDEQRRAYILADNKLATNSSWDEKLLKVEVADLVNAGFDMTTAGFGVDELAIAMMGGAGKDPDAVPPTPAIPTTRVGDVWICGPHRIICGDATNPDAWDGLLIGEKIDLVVTSPPYNVGIKYSEHVDKAPRESYLEFLRQVGEPMVKRLRGGRFVAWNVGVSPKTFPAYQVVTLEGLGLSFYRQIVWQKSGVPYPTFQSSLRTRAARHYKPNYKHELIYLFEREARVNLKLGECPTCDGSGKVAAIDANLAPAHEAIQLLSYGQPEYGAAIAPDKKYSADVWNIAQSMATVDLETLGTRSSGLEHGGKRGHMIKSHPAAFPVELPRAILSMLTAANEIVVDPFGGSGSTAIASHQLGRRARLIEKDPAYVDVSVQRWQDFTGGTAILEGSGQSFEDVKRGRQRHETKADPPETDLGKPGQAGAQSQRAEAGRKPRGGAGVDVGKPEGGLAVRNRTRAARDAEKAGRVGAARVGHRGGSAPPGDGGGQQVRDPDQDADGRADAEPLPASDQPAGADHDQGGGRVGLHAVQ